MKMYTSLWNKMTHTRRWKRLTKKWMHGLHYFHTRSNNDIFVFLKKVNACYGSSEMFLVKKKKKTREKKRTGRKAWPVSLDIYVDIHIHFCCSLSVSMFVNMIYTCTLRFRHILYTSQSINIWNVEIIRSDYIQITISKYIISQYINTHTYLEPYTYEVTFHYVKSDLVRDNVVTPMVSPLDTMRGKNTN